jgi:hypothetical protein
LPEARTWPVTRSDSESDGVFCLRRRRLEGLAGTGEDDSVASVDSVEHVAISICGLTGAGLWKHVSQGFGGVVSHGNLLSRKTIDGVYV